MVDHNRTIRTLITLEYMPVDKDEENQILSKTTIYFHYNRAIKEEILENFHPTYSKASLKKYYDVHWNMVNEEYYEDDVLEISTKDFSTYLAVCSETRPSARNELSPPGEVLRTSIMDSPIEIDGRREIMKDLVSTTGVRYDLIIDINSRGDFVSQRSVTQDTQKAICLTIYSNEYNEQGHLTKQTAIQLPQGSRLVIEKSYEYY